MAVLDSDSDSGWSMTQLESVRLDVAPADDPVGQSHTMDEREGTSPPLHAGLIGQDQWLTI